MHSSSFKIKERNAAIWEGGPEISRPEAGKLENNPSFTGVSNKPHLGSNGPEDLCGILAEGINECTLMDVIWIGHNVLAGIGRSSRR